MSKIEKTLKNRKVWGRGETEIKDEKEEVTGNGDITKMKRWHKKSTFKALPFAS